MFNSDDAKWCDLLTYLQTPPFIVKDIYKIVKNIDVNRNITHNSRSCQCTLLQNVLSFSLEA